uniref:C-type lectin domain-containing protein n=1 Tax=Magallana gigas TaxID=29159 RepID=A0A8W8NW69_MAGGI
MYSFSKLYITLTLVFPYHINCDLQHSRFSNSGEKDLTGWTSDAIFDRHNYSRVRCGILCLEDQCCEKFLYSASTRRCIGLHFMDFYSSSFENSVLTMYEGMKAYQKGCEIGWFEFKGHCYIQVQGRYTWDEAKNECEKMCSYLVEIDSQDENDFLTTTIINKDNCGTETDYKCSSWTGGNDIDMEGGYVWDHSYTDLNFTNWSPQEPSEVNPDSALSRDCIDIKRSGFWVDRPCSTLNSFVCEKFSEDFGDFKVDFDMK